MLDLDAELQLRALDELFERLLQRVTACVSEHDSRPRVDWTRRINLDMPPIYWTSLSANLC
jgi:hypothetical protein